MNQIPDDLDRRLAEQRQRSNPRHVEFMEWVDQRHQREKRWRPHYAISTQRFDFSNLLWEENVLGDIGGEIAGRHFPVFANANGFGEFASASAAKHIANPRLRAATGTGALVTQVPLPLQ